LKARSLSAHLGREPTQREFTDHTLDRLRADPRVRAMAMEAAKQAREASA
jgi:hypothetical protein